MNRRNKENRGIKKAQSNLLEGPVAFSKEGKLVWVKSPFRWLQEKKRALQPQSSPSSFNLNEKYLLRELVVDRLVHNYDFSSDR